jgi:hypothetical protein
MNANFKAGKFICAYEEEQEQPETENPAQEVAQQPFNSAREP